MVVVSTVDRPLVCLAHFAGTPVSSEAILFQDHLSWRRGDFLGIEDDQAEETSWGSTTLTGEYISPL